MAAQTKIKIKSSLESYPQKQLERGMVRAMTLSNRFPMAAESFIVYKLILQQQSTIKKTPIKHKNNRYRLCISTLLAQKTVKSTKTLIWQSQLNQPHIKQTEHVKRLNLILCFVYRDINRVD